jgi:hypothetical protein
MRHLRDNGLSIIFGMLFLGALAGQSVVGNRAFNDEQLAHGAETMSYWRYLVSSGFGQAVLENWQSEWLQFVLFIFVTVWFIQKGSNESKPRGEEGLESDQKQRIGGYAPENAPRWAKVGGWRTALYSNSLVLVMAALFFGSWAGQSVTDWTRYNDEQRQHDQPSVSWSGYVARADFWERTLQNWQSEFLAVGAMAAFTIYLRQRGSPESKPVGSPHSETGTSG